LFVGIEPTGTKPKPLTTSLRTTVLRFWWLQRDDDDFLNGDGIGGLLGIKLS
jgi:hypothetical protein